jgi:nitrate reductase gamma subunit
MIGTAMTWYDILLWGVLPYVVVALLVSGTVWRYRYDRFGWTTRSSQLYESRLLRIGSPLFHFGLLVVIVGHVIGLVIPKSWTDAAGLSQDAYHLQALLLGTIAGISTLVGIGILIYRRRTTGPVFIATTRNDKLMYVVLVAAIVAGLTTTLLGIGGGEAHDYRQSVSLWFRSLPTFQPDVAAMARAGVEFKVHALIGMLLFATWPFTRLVHAYSAPDRLPVPPLRRRPSAAGRSGHAGVPAGPARLGADRLLIGAGLSRGWPGRPCAGSRRCGRAPRAPRRSSPARTSAGRRRRRAR